MRIQEIISGTLAQLAAAKGSLTPEVSENIQAFYTEHAEEILATKIKTEAVNSTEKPINPLNTYTQEALMVAAKCGNDQIAAWLAEIKTVNVNFQDDSGATALMHAASKGHAKVVRVLREAGTLVNNMNKDKKTEIMLAAENGHSEVVDVLLEIGEGLIVAHPQREKSFSEPSGPNALMLAAAGGHTEIVAKLATRTYLNAIANPEEQVAQVNERDKTGATALSYAAETGNAATVQILLEAGARVDLIDSKGDTPLKRAVRAGNLETMNALASAGANHLENMHAIEMRLASMRASAGVEAKCKVILTSPDTVVLDAEMLKFAAEVGAISSITSIVDKGVLADVPQATGNALMHLAQENTKHAESTQRGQWVWDLLSKVLTSTELLDKGASTNKQAVFDLWARLTMISEAILDWQPEKMKDPVIYYPYEGAPGEYRSAIETYLKANKKTQSKTLPVTDIFKLIEVCQQALGDLLFRLHREGSSVADPEGTLVITEATRLSLWYAMLRGNDAWARRKFAIAAGPDNAGVAGAGGGDPVVAKAEVIEAALAFAQRMMWKQFMEASVPSESEDGEESWWSISGDEIEGLQEEIMAEYQELTGQKFMPIMQNYINPLFDNLREHGWFSMSQMYVAHKKIIQDASRLESLELQQVITQALQLIADEIKVKFIVNFGRASEDGTSIAERITPSIAYLGRLETCRITINLTPEAGTIPIMVNNMSPLKELCSPR